MAHRRVRTTHEPFVRLSRSKRADAVIALKGRLRRNKALYGGRFDSDQILDDGRPPEDSQWFDFVFPSASDRFMLWNAMITTAGMAFHDKVSDLAYAEVKASMTAEDYERAHPPLEFEPNKDSRTGKILSYSMVSHPQLPQEQFEGRTVREQREHLEGIIAKERPPEIFESFVLDPQYRYGCGLHIVVDEPTIDRAAIERAIDRFVANGEKGWTETVPVPRDRLPDGARGRNILAQSRSMRMDDMD